MNEINTNLNPDLIFAKLDRLDKKGADEKIEACVWNQFAKVAGGKEIKNEILKEDAIKSISTYIARASSEVKEQIANFLNMQSSRNEYLKANYTEEQRQSLLMTDEELEQKRQELAKEVVDVKASNGMNYETAMKKISKLWLDFMGMGSTGFYHTVPDFGAKELERLELEIRKYCPEYIPEFIQAKDALLELQSKNPEIRAKYESYREVCNSIGSRKAGKKMAEMFEEKLKGRFGIS